MRPDLHPFIVALVSLAANIGANHPKQGLYQRRTQCAVVLGCGWQ